jgi:hypothetical protein
MESLDCEPRYGRTCRGRLKRDGTRAETRFRLSPKRTSPFKSAGASFQSTTGSRGVRISVSNAGYTAFGGSVKSTGYTLHSPVSLSLLLPCVTVSHHVPNALYYAIIIALWQRALYLPYPLHMFVVQGTKFYWSLTLASRDTGDPALRSLCEVPLTIAQSRRSRYDV